jgi:hypothetical protein
MGKVLSESAGPRQKMSKSHEGKVLSAATRQEDEPVRMIMTERMPFSIRFNPSAHLTSS